jgi:hypothetical protein
MARAQGAQASAKEDTRFLALGGALATDLSQYLTNLTALAPGAYEAPTTRAVLDLERTVSVRWTATAAEVGKVLLVCANTAQTDIVWAIATDGTGRVCGYIDALSGVIAATNPTAAKDYTISMSQRANPETTGASDAVITELAIYNHTDGVWEDTVQAAHSVPTTGSGPYNLSVGGWWNGATLTNTPTNAPTIARVSSQHHPHTEVAEDWIAARTAYAGSADDGPSEPIGPIPSSSEIGDESEIAGRHPWAYAAKHAELARRRAWSPLINEVWSDDNELPDAIPANWSRSIPVVSSATMSIAWLRWVQVPRGATHAWTRIHVRQWVEAGDAVKIRYYAVAMNRAPSTLLIGNAPAPALVTKLVSADLEVDDELGTGVWLELGYLALPKLELELTGWRDTVHLCLGFEIDPLDESENDGNARFLIDAWHARPASRDVPWTKQEL